MDKYDYVITKPEMEEVLYHAGFHKYIDKYLGKNGKWIYKYAGQAKGAATGAINKAKTMLPGLQKQATGAVSTVKKKASSLASTGSRTASSVKKQAKSRISSMLPILSKKLNKAKKQARSQAAGVKLVARDKTKKLKKQADGTIKNASAQIKKTKDKNLYQRAKRKVGEKTGKYKRDDGYMTTTFEGNHSKMMGDSRYRTPYSRDANLGFRGYPHAKMRSHMNNYAQYLAKTRKTRSFVTSKRNSSAAKRARTNRRAK